MASSRTGCRRADHGAGRRARRLLRAVRARADPDHQRPEGQEGRHPGLGSSSHLLLSIMAAMSGSTRTRTSTGSTNPDRRLQGAVRRRQDRRFSWLAAGVAGAARPQDRPRDPQHGHGPAVVAVLLLPGGAATGTSSASIRSRPSAFCAPSSRPPTSAPPSRRRQHNGWSMAASRDRYEYALQTLTELPYDQLARVRPRGLAALLRAAASRGRHDHDQPERAPRRRHRLALPQRAQARAEGVSHVSVCSF